MRKNILAVVALALCVVFAQAGDEPCTDKCKASTTVTVNFPQPMPGPKAPATVVVNTQPRGPVARVLGWLWRPAGTTIVVR